MIPPSRAALVALVLAAAGCNVFDARLYKESGAPDLGAVDAGGDAMANDIGLCGRASTATLCNGTALFCDGFEDENGGDLNQWTGIAVGSPGGAAPAAGTALAVDSGAVCLGSHALHARTVGGAQQAFAYRMLANRPPTLHVRLYFQLAQYSRPFQLLGFHAGSGDYSTLYVDPAAARFFFATSFSTTMSVFPGASLPVGRWMCMELVVRFDNANGEIALWLDGKLLGDYNGGNTQPAGSLLDTINIGIVSTDGADPGTNEVYVDEVAMSPAALGCN
jgi:hypothetical protein